MGKQAIVAVTGLLLLAGGSLWVVTRDADDVSGPRGPAAAGPAAPPEGGPGNAPGLASAGHRPPPAPAGTSAGEPPAPSAATGALDIEVVSSAGTPLAGEGVMVEHDGRLEALRRRRFARTGADGRARVGGLDAGSVRVHSGRGGEVRADVPTGGVGSVRVALERGVTVEGVVVDAEGAPVPAAGLFIDVGGTGKLSCLQVGTTDDAGRFRLEDVAAFASVSARRPGRTPSGARRVAGQPGQSDRMKLVIGGPGAAVRGTVVDAQGRPVAGAVVFVGQAFPPPMALPDGGHGTGPVGVAAWTDVRGEFEVDPVEPAATSVTVRAAGHAPYRRPTTLVSGLNTVTVTLGTPYAIEVRVATPTGTPPPGATADRFFHAGADGPVPADPADLRTGRDAALSGRWTVRLHDGTEVEVEPLLASLRRRLDAESTPELVGPRCGIHPDTIRTLARWVAGGRTHVLVPGGMSKYFPGDLMARSMLLLLALTGNWGRKGAGTGGWSTGVFDGHLFAMSKPQAGVEGAAAVLGLLEASRDAMIAADPTLTPELAAVQLWRTMGPLSGMVPPFFFWYRHAGTAARQDDPALSDPGQVRPFREYLDEALDAGWWPGADQPSTPPRVLLEIAGNMLRRTRGGKTVLLEHLWPQLEKIVVVDVRMSETARHADILLPAASSYEKVGFGMPTPWTMLLGFSDAAGYPPVEAKGE